MNIQAHKCKRCKKAFTPARIDQKYCSGKCRQAAYRRRKTGKAGKHKQAAEKPLLAATCAHCGGAFWTTSRKATFCSTSCRTLHHRALKAAIPQALMILYNLPMQKALDVVETQPTAQVRQLLEAAGYRYHHQQRQWITTP